MDKAQVQQACAIIRALREHAERARQSECAALDTQIDDLDAAARLIGEYLDKIERLEIKRDSLEAQRDYLQQRYLEALRAAHGGEGCL